MLSELPKTSGIYELVNSIDGKRYIGSCVNFYKRAHKHLSELKKGRHANRYLQNAFNKHGESSFVFNVLEYCEKDLLIKAEQNHIDSNNFELLYNLRKVAASNLGMRHSQETVNKMKKAKKDFVFSKEHKKNISLAKAGTVARSGHKISKEHAEALIKVNFKKVYCPELNKTFDSRVSAAKEFGVSTGAISQAIKKGCKIGGTYSLTNEVVK